MFELDDKRLFIVRGLPGEGKSTLARSLVGGDENRVVENDQFWTYGGRTYSFHDEMWSISRDWALCETFRRLLHFDAVAVANVFFAKRFVIPYLYQARVLGVKITIARPTTPWMGDVDACFAKCKHGCPLERLQRFKEKWEDIDQTWIEQYMETGGNDE